MPCIRVMSIATCSQPHPDAHIIDGALDHRLLVSIKKMLLMVHRVVYSWQIHTHTHAVCGGYLDLLFEIELQVGRWRGVRCAPALMVMATFLSDGHGTEITRKAMILALDPDTFEHSSHGAAGVLAVFNG